jgi:Ca2+/H+ antiporter, TMEM165/GDT1 family
MRKKWWIFLVAPPALVLFIALGGWIVMHLWNWLVPGIIGWRQITFWQALGILLLCRILFGGFHGGRGPRSRMRERMRERWAEKMEHMTPEEREQFRQRMGRCGFPSPATEAKEGSTTGS